MCAGGLARFFEAEKMRQANLAALQRCGGVHATALCQAHQRQTAAGRQPRLGIHRRQRICTANELQDNVSSIGRGSALPEHEPCSATLHKGLLQGAAHIGQPAIFKGQLTPVSLPRRPRCRRQCWPRADDIQGEAKSGTGPVACVRRTAHGDDSHYRRPASYVFPCSITWARRCIRRRSPSLSQSPP